LASVLVTGANGHIGANTVRSLLKRGHRVIPFVRPSADLRGIEKLGLAYRRGDIRDYPSLLTAVQGCDVIIHHATVYQLSSQTPEEIIQPALIGTENIFKAAREAGVSRLVYTSSIAAVGYSRNSDKLRTPEDWNDDPLCPYYVAKTRSEREALRLSEQYGIPTIRLCPTQVIGAYDYRLTPSMKSILDFINHKTPLWVGGANFVNVNDVAEVHAAAVDCGEPGGRYIIGGENMDMDKLAILLKEMTGVAPIRNRLHGPFAEFLAGIIAFAYRAVNAEPPYDRGIVHDLVGRYGYFDCTLTSRTFGVKPKGAEESLRDTIRWLLFLGKIKEPVASRITSTFPPDPEWLTR
jgi:dihydroflavonol-4-reductase